MRNFAVIGLGRFGYSVTRTLSENGAYVLAIDKDLDKVQEVRDIATQAVQLNALDEKSLKAIGFSEIDVAIVSIGTDMESSILITLTLKQLGVEEVIAKALNDIHAKVLEKVGASRIVFPEREMGHRLVMNLISPNFIEYINLSKEYSIIEISPPEKIVGSSIREAQIRSRYHVDIIALRTINEDNKEQLEIVPEPDYVITSSDTLIIIGRREFLEKFSS
ncbi:potassium channel family protein [Chlamydiota bacterium]